MSVCLGLSVVDNKTCARKDSKRKGKACPYNGVWMHCDVVNGACNTAVNCNQAPAVDVAHQAHYEAMKIEPIEFAMASLTPEEFKGFLKANIIKYIGRAGRKGQEQQDYAKARQYAAWLEEFAGSGTIAQFAGKGARP